LADAVCAGRAKVVEVLLQAGANPNVSIGGYPNLGSGGYTYPLHLACRSGHPGIVKLLIDAGADVNQLNSAGETPLGLGWYNGDIGDMLRAAGAKLPPTKPTEKKVEEPKGLEWEIKPDSDEDGNEF
jgi:ankyrin repeat protein